MAQALTTLSPADTFDNIAAQLEADGAAIIVDLIAPSLVEQLRADLVPFLDDRRCGGRSGDPVWQLVHGKRTKRLASLPARSAAVATLMLHPTLRAYADHFLLPNCGSYRLNTAQLIAIGPGQRAQPLHRDEASWPHVGQAGPEIVVGAMIALSAFTATNGATRVVPGSHRWSDPMRQPDDEGEIAASEMSPGSALLYTGKIIHGGGENLTTDAWRLGIHLSFVLGWLRPEENHYLSTPPQRIQHLPRRAQELLGFTSYRAEGLGGRLGLVDAEEIEPPFDATHLESD